MIASAETQHQRQGEQQRRGRQGDVEPPLDQPRGAGQHRRIDPEQRHSLEVVDLDRGAEDLDQVGDEADLDLEVRAAPGDPRGGRRRRGPGAGSPGRRPPARRPSSSPDSGAPEEGDSVDRVDLQVRGAPGDPVEGLVVEVGRRPPRPSRGSRSGPGRTRGEASSSSPAGAPSVRSPTSSARSRGLHRVIALRAEALAKRIPTIAATRKAAAWASSYPVGPGDLRVRPEPQGPDQQRVKQPGHVVDGRVADPLRVAVIQPVDLEQGDPERQRDKAHREIEARPAAMG